MCDIYSQAYFNLAASALSGSSGTLFRNRKCFSGSWHKRRCCDDPCSCARLLEKHDIDVTGFGEATDCKVSVRYSFDRIHRQVLGVATQYMNEEEPLLDRAWVLQERLLSRRTIYITNSEVIWECRSCCLCECGMISRPLDFSMFWEESSADPLYVTVLFRDPPTPLKVEFAQVCSPTRLKDEVHDFWCRIVKAYTKLLLSYEVDRPIAIAGIAQKISRSSGMTYLGGLWLEALAYSLGWLREFKPSSSRRRLKEAVAASGETDAKDKAKNLGATPSAPGSPNSPTWSWLSRLPGSLTTQVAWHAGGFVQDPRFKVHEPGTFCEYARGDSFGQVLSGQIQCTGVYEIAMLLSHPDNPREGRYAVYFGPQAHERMPQGISVMLLDIDGDVVELERRRQGRCWTDFDFGDSSNNIEPSSVTNDNETATEHSNSGNDQVPKQYGILHRRACYCLLLGMHRYLNGEARETILAIRSHPEKENVWVRLGTLTVTGADRHVGKPPTPDPVDVAALASDPRSSQFPPAEKSAIWRSRVFDEAVMGSFTLI